MTLTKEKLEEIKRRYSSLILTDSDVEDAIDFVYDILTAEADAIKAEYPYATNSIKRLEDAAHEVNEIKWNILDME